MQQNRNIELGTFTWDSSKLSDQIAANYLQLDKLSSKVRDGNAAIKLFNKTIDELEQKIEDEYKAQEELNERLEQGRISQEEYTEAIEQSNKEISNYIDEQQQAIKAQADYAIEITNTQREISDLRREQRELNTLMAGGITEISDQESAYKELVDQMNAAKLESKNLGAELAEMKNSGLNEEEPERYRELAAAYAEATERARGLHEQVLAIDIAVGDNQRNVGNYKKAITDAFSEITDGIKSMASGDIKGGFEAIKSGFSGMKAAAAEAFAFIMANPLVALAAALLAIGAGIYKGIEYIIDYNESIKESVKLTEDLTKTSGKLADQIRLRAQGIVDTFGGEFEETLKTANTLVKQLGITYEEAFKKIEEGYIRGANANGDFLDRLSEYGPLLNKYGFNLEEIIGLQIQAQEQGLFGDKFEDSIKEAGLSLEEFTKAQSDAISNAFGPAFANKISHDVNSGAITVKDALILMSAEAKKQGLSVQQFGVLTADVFKGAGEDIGGAQVMFENIYKGVNKLQEPLTELQKKTLAVSEANYELGKAKDDALKSDKLTSFMNDWDLFSIKIETIFFKFIGLITSAISWFDDLTGGSEVLAETWDALSDVVDSLWEAVESIVDVFNDLFEALGDNNGETNKYIKSILKSFNPLTYFKNLLLGITSVIKGFSSAIQSSRISITAFAITTKSVLSQLADAAKSFLSLDFEGGLNKLKNINISKEFADARKEAERIVALNNANKNKKITEEPPVKDNTTASNKNKSTTQADRDAAAKAAEEARKKAEAEAKKAEAKRIADAKKAAADAKKAMEEEAKRVIEIARSEAEQKSDIAKIELAQYIANNAEKYKNDKTLLQSKLKDQLAYFDEVKKLQQQANNVEEVAKIFAIQQKIDEINKKKELNQNDLNERKLLLAEIDNIHRDYYNKEIELNNDTNEKKRELNKKYEEDIQAQKDLKQALAFQKKIIQLESEHATESVIQQVQLDSDTQQRLEQFLKENELKRKLDQENYDTNAEIQAQRTELESQIALVNDENEKLRLQNKLNELTVIQQGYSQKSKEIDKALTDAKLDGFSTVFGAAKTAFGEQTAVGKAAAIAETTINTYKSAQSAYSSLAGIPIIGPALGAAAAAFAVVQGLANVRKIMSVKGYANSGLVDGGFEISRSNGDNRLVTVKDGEVILNENHQAMLGGASTFKAIGVPGFANSGVVGSSLASIQKNFRTETPMITLDQNAVSEIADAIYSGSQAGISELSENRNIAKNSNF